MALEIREEPLSALAEHAMIPIAFRVERVLDVSAVTGGLGGLVLGERSVEPSYEKDYDALQGEGPTRWPKRFDVSNWGLIAAHRDTQRLGGAVIAFDTANVDMLERRHDLAVLWDLRVRVRQRGQGVGSQLFEAVEDWARARGCRQLKVETQNINVPACRIYAHMGCTLGSIDRFAYPEAPEETQLVWCKELGAQR
jgi:GNAT superfamily N-acetyltransferase